MSVICLIVLYLLPLVLLLLLLLRLRLPLIATATTSTTITTTTTITNAELTFSDTYGNQILPLQQLTVGLLCLYLFGFIHGCQNQLFSERDTHKSEQLSEHRLLITDQRIRLGIGVGLLWGGGLGFRKGQWECELLDKKSRQTKSRVSPCVSVYCR